MHVRLAHVQTVLKILQPPVHVMRTASSTARVVKDTLDNSVTCVQMGTLEILYLTKDVDPVSVTEILICLPPGIVIHIPGNVCGMFCSFTM